MSLWGATELSDFISTGNNATDTTAGRFSNTYGVRGAVRVGDGSNAAYNISTGTGLGAFSSFFSARVFVFKDSGDTGRYWWQFFSDVGVGQLRVGSNSGQLWPVQRWDGSGWTNCFSIQGTNAAINQVDIIVEGMGTSSGRIRAYIGNSQVGDTGTIDLTALSNIDEIRFYSNRSNLAGEDRISELIWGDEPTIAHRYCPAHPTGNGFYTAGSGAFGDVDENGSDDADFSNLVNVGDAETYTHGAMTLPATGTVKSVQVTARIRRASTGPQNAKARLRMSSTDYDASVDYPSMGLGYSPYRYRWATNPAGGNWSLATAAATSVEFGIVATT